MGYTNNTTDKKEKTSSKTKVAVNSLQSTALVRRLCVSSAYNLDGIYSYDNDNLYPDKVIAIKQRSWALTSATETLADFITGDGFENDDINKVVLNSDGATGYDFLRYISKQRNTFGFAVHVNYNIQLQVYEFNEIDFESLRVSTKNTLIWRKDWSKIGVQDDAVEYNRFNPDTVRDEIIEAGGIEEYKGQVLYWTGTNKIYPLSTFDAALDSGQYQAENELFKLRNLQNDWMPSGALQYPANTDNKKEAEAIKKNVADNGTGADNAGRLLLLGSTPDMEGGIRNIWTPFERNNVDKLYETQNKEAKETIFSVMRQPTILGAINPGGGWPNMQEMEDAFVYYNSITEQERKEVEKTLTKLFAASVWSEFSEVKILPKMLIKAEDKKEIKEGSTDGTE